MGWLKIGARTVPQQTGYDDLKASSQHIEILTINPRYPFASIDTKDRDLRFILATEVSKRTSAGTGGLRKSPNLVFSQLSSLPEISHCSRQHRL
jgi:hypothetical protein